MNMFYLIAIVLISFFVGLFFLVWMVKKYYWGPTGLPPKDRYKAGARGEEESMDSRQ